MIGQRVLVARGRIAAAFLVAAALCSAGGRACTVGFGAPARAADGAAYAFCGTVIALDRDASGNVWATLCVREIWKGDVPDTVVVVTENSSCGAPFALGGEFFVCPDPPTVEFANQAAHDGIDPGVRWRGPAMQAWITSCGRFETYGDAALASMGRPLRVGNDQTARTRTLQELARRVVDAENAEAADAVRMLGYCSPLLECLATSADPRHRDRFDDVIEILAAELDPSRRRDPHVRNAAAGALAELGPLAADAVPAFLAGLEGSFERDRSVLFSLVQVGHDDPRALAALAAMARDPDDAEKRDWARSVFWQGAVPMTPEAPQPGEFLQDRDPDMRRYAYRALGRTADQDGLEQLATAVLADPDPGVAAGALPSLISRLSDERVLPWVLAALTHPDARVRAGALGNSGMRARPAVLRCRIVEAFRTSPFDDVLERLDRTRKMIGADCD
ncbi:MAG: HEAT repeat domain-containing protein [Candidatus Krumholzibacteriia bacterium]